MKKFAISFVVILFLLYNTNMFYKEASALGIGKEAAPFILKDLEGNEVKLADFRGKKVVLHFFTTWCPSCQEEMPLLVRFYEQMDQKKGSFSWHQFNKSGEKQKRCRFVYETISSKFSRTIR